MDKEKLKEIVFDQREVFNRQRDLVDRSIDYIRYIKTKQIVIISGVRRSGKSSLLRIIKDKMELGDADYCYFNFEDERVVNYTTLPESIYYLHLELFGKEPVLIFDEIQNVNHWELFVNRMYEKGLKIFVTGSTARLLSSEISSGLTGRNMVIELFPFSFSEYLRFLEHSYDISFLSSTQKALLQKDFNNYFNTGGFPLAIAENDPELLNSYFRDIFYRDIIVRFKISSVSEIKQIALYFLSNISKLFSYAALQDISGVKSLSSVKSYLHYFEQAYLFLYLKKFDFSITKQLKNSRKVYTIDIGFAHSLGFNFSENKGRLLENIVYIELLRRGFEVFYYSDKKECDFLIKKGLNVIQAIQVTYTLNNLNYEREVEGLIEATQKFKLKKGYILVNDYDADIQYTQDNIVIIPVWKWLLEV